MQPTPGSTLRVRGLSVGAASLARLLYWPGIRGLLEAVAVAGELAESAVRDTIKTMSNVRFI